MNKNFGILFRISGLPGSGKTELSKLIHKDINILFGPTVIWSGDDLRNILNNKKYTLRERNKFGIINVKLIKLINSQKINVIFATVGLKTAIRNYFKKHIPNYIEIVVKTQLADLRKRGNRVFYSNGSKNVWGLDIKIEYPTNPDILIENDFKKNLNVLKKKLIKGLVNLKKLKLFKVKK